MKRPGTPLLFVLSNQPSPQQKNTAPPYGLPTPPNFPALPTTYYPTRVTFSFYSQPTAAPSWRKTPPLPTPLSHSPKLSHPSHHLLPDPVDSLILLPPNQPPSQRSGATPPGGTSRALNFPTLPSTYCPTQVTFSFYSRPTAPYPAEKHRPTRWPPRAPKLSHPSHHLLPDPIGPLFLCPVQAPPPLSGKHRPTRWPPRTPKLSHPSHHLLPDPVASLFYVPPNPTPSQEKYRSTRWPPRTPKLPRPPQHLLPNPVASFFLFPANRPLPSRKTPPLPTPLSHSPKLPYPSIILAADLANPHPFPCPPG